MSLEDERQRRLTVDALASLAGTDFALAGSGAIREHGITNRPTQDVDLFTTRADPRDFDKSVNSLVQGLTTRGYAVEVIRRADVFARLHVQTSDGTALELDLAYDWRGTEPDRTSVGPVLSLEDAVASKIGAVFSRGETRDFLDADAIRRSGRFTDDELLRIAAERDLGFDQTEFARQLLLVSQLSATETRRYNVSADELIGVQGRLTDWARVLLVANGKGDTP